MENNSHITEPLPSHHRNSLDTLNSQIRLDILHNLSDITDDSYKHPGEIYGYNQRTNNKGHPTAKVWIIRATYPIKLGDESDSNPWSNNSDFVSFGNFILKRLIDQADQFGFPKKRRFFLAINYYDPSEEFDIKNPVFPWHTDFNIMTFLCSDGPTWIYEEPKWKEINLYSDGPNPRYQIQFGSLAQILSKNKINALPHGVGRSPVFPDGLGKISIVGILDLDSDVEVEFVSPSGKVALMTSGEYSRLRFKASYPSIKEKELEHIPEGIEAECSRLADEPENRELYREYIAHLNVFPRPFIG